MNLSFRYLVLDHSSFRCWLEDHLGLGLFVLQVILLAAEHDLIDSAIGTAVDFVAGFLGSLCSISLEYFVVKAVSHMKM